MGRGMEKKSSTLGLIYGAKKKWLLGTPTDGAMCCGTPVLLIQVRTEVRLLIYI